MNLLHIRRWTKEPSMLKPADLNLYSNIYMKCKSWKNKIRGRKKLTRWRHGCRSETLVVWLWCGYEHESCVIVFLVSLSSFVVSKPVVGDGCYEEGWVYGVLLMMIELDSVGYMCFMIWLLCQFWWLEEEDKIMLTLWWVVEGSCYASEQQLTVVMVLWNELKNMMKVMVENQMEVFVVTDGWNEHVRRE